MNDCTSTRLNEPSGKAFFGRKMPRNQKRQIEYDDILVIFNDFLFYVGEGGYKG